MGRKVKIISIILILIIAMVTGAVYYQNNIVQKKDNEKHPNSDGKTTFTIHFDETHNFGGYSGGYGVYYPGDHVRFEVDIENVNITWVEFRVNWRSASATSDVEIELLSPKMEGPEFTSERGVDPGVGHYRTARVEINDVPDPYVIEAKDMDEVNETVIQNFTSTNGTGRWLIDATFTTGGLVHSYVHPSWEGRLYTHVAILENSTTPDSID